MPQVDQVSSSCPSIGAILYYPHLSPFNESSVWVRNIPGWKIVVFSVRPQFALPKLPGGTILRLKETGFFISNFQLGGQTCDAGELEIGGLGHLLLSSKIKGLWNLSKKKRFKRENVHFPRGNHPLPIPFACLCFFLRIGTLCGIFLGAMYVAKPSSEACFPPKMENSGWESDPRIAENWGVL